MPCLVQMRRFSALLLIACLALRAPAFLSPVQNSKNGVSVPESIRGQRPLIMPQDARQFVPPSSETGSFSWFCRLSAAAACAVIASTAKQQRAEKIVVRIFPSRCMSRQKTMRRLEPFGEMPAWSRKPLLRRRLKQPWRKRPIRRLSPYGRYLYERSRLRVHYNINVRQLTKYVLRAFKEGRKHPNWPFDGNPRKPHWQLLLACWDCPNHGRSPLHGARESHSDQISGGNLTTTKNLSGWQWTCLRIFWRLEIRFVFDQSQGRRNLHRGIRRKMVRWMCQITLSGTEINLRANTTICVILIKLASLSMRTSWSASSWALRAWDRGTSVGLKEPPFPLIRSTTEVAFVQLLKIILNMKRGFGLRARGYKRPPCLWGRKTNPLNDPWEYGSKVKVWGHICTKNLNLKREESDRKSMICMIERCILGIGCLSSQSEVAFVDVQCHFSSRK